MRKYRVRGLITLEIYAEVEAESAEEAEQHAYELGVPPLCYRCSRSETGEWRLSDPSDCDPMDVKVEAET